MPRVSVVIPAYNRAGSITRAMESVLGQSFTDLELLVVDDASRDATVDIASRISDPRVRIMRNLINLGAAGARNIGVAAARGEWVAFQDSDDEWLPQKLARQLDAIDESVIAVYCQLLTLGGLDGRETRRHTPDHSVTPLAGMILPSLLRTNLISTQTLVVRRRIFERLDGFDVDTTPIEDWEFALRLCQLGPIAFVDAPLVRQRFSANSITRDTRRRLAAHARVLEKHADLWQAHPALLARQYYILAGGHRRLGDWGQSRRYLALARRTDPGNPRVWAQTFYSSALGLAAIGVGKKPG